MRGRKFNGTHPHIGKVSGTISDLTRCWSLYRSARLIYAEAWLHHNTTHHGFDTDAMAESTTAVFRTRAEYMVTIDNLKGAHRNYKTAFRNLLTGKLL